MGSTDRESSRRALLVGLWWSALLPILSFLVGVFLLIYDGVISPPSDYTTSGVGLILAGLAPAAVKDIPSLLATLAEMGKRKE